MLAAAEALGNASASGNYTRRLAFVALAGEPWGLMGSRRLLYQMHAAAPAVRGLALDAVEQARATCASAPPRP
jgi:nicastrin